ncbi:efflux RND transporter periplasmic adaptor subunit [bacterium]|nr:efflux RND transporter periplasmic adaptor subunit [bacterium]MBU1074127.1 efflux RND transporter periplasmic adaptor subunit [bacterium]MBU1676828.1 efflux RND transporter periplasmic adaptor subunit [bacterium]
MNTHKEHVMFEIVIRGRRLAVPVLVASLLLAAGCAHRMENEVPGEVARNVRVLEMSPTDLEEFFEISGPLRPVRGADVSAEEMGTVYAIPHDKGETVVEGDGLVELDRRLLAAEMAAAGDDLKLRAHTAENTAALFAAGKVSETEMLGADAARAQAEAVYRIASLRHERAAVKAPFAGVVVDRYVEPGQLVSPGMPVARVIDPFVLKLAGTVSEREVAWLRGGAPATIVLEGMNEQVAGKVAWIGFEADTITGKFKVEVHVDNADLSLRAGVVARARIHKITHENVLVLPRDAVMYTTEGLAVFVVEGERAALRPVTLGPDQGLMVVIGSGLRSGESVVVRGHRDLVDGALVEVTEHAAARDGSRGGDPAEVVESASTGGAREAGR